MAEANHNKLFTMAGSDAAIDGVAGAIGSLIAISATYPLLQVPTAIWFI